MSKPPRPQFNLTDDQRSKIKFFRTEYNLTPSEIRRKIVKPNGKLYQLKVIRKWVDRVDQTEDCKLLPKSGRPRKLDLNQEEKLIENIRMNCKARGGYTTIRRCTSLFNMTTRTVNNYGLRNGFRTYRAVKKPLLKPAHINERKRFCDYWLTRPDDCRRIVIVDEKLFNNQPNNNYQPVLRKKGERFQPEHIHYGVRPNENAKCNILAYIGPFGKGEVFVAEHKDWFNLDGSTKEDRNPARAPGLDGSSYEMLIEHHFLPSAKEKMGDEKWLFMQDNAPIHSVKRPNQELTNIQQIFRDENIEMVKLPPLSPDLTPIENVFSLLAREYSKLFDNLVPSQYPKCKMSTFNIIKQAWENVDNEKVKKIYFSFYDRLHKVKRAQGLNNFK